MKDDLEKIKEIFLASDVDDDERAENEETIREWEQSISEHKAIDTWRKSDITLKVGQQARDSYKAMAMQLALNRELSEKERLSLWARQDACKLLLSFIEVDAKGALESIHNEIRTALNATN